MHLEFYWDGDYEFDCDRDCSCDLELDSDCGCGFDGDGVCVSGSVVGSWIVVWHWNCVGMMSAACL